MADFWKDYDNGKFSVGGKKNEEKKKSTSFWDEYDSGKYTVGGDRGSNDLKKLEELLAEKGLGRTAYRLPESLSKPVADTRNESQKQYDEYLGTLRSSDDIQKELNVVGDALKIERDKRRSYVRNQLRDGNDITMATGKPQANAELDSRISKLQNRYSELEQELKSNTYANYERNRLADDFAENSKYRSTDNGGAHSRMDLFGDTLITGYGNWKSEIINRNPDALAALDKQPTLAALNERTAGAGLATGSSIDLASLTGNDYSWTQSMTDDQVSMYNYLANTKGTEAADEYLDYIRSDVYAADRARIESEAQAYANAHPVLASGKTVLQAPMKGIAYVGQTIDYLADGKIDENAPYNRYSYEPTAMRNAVQKQVGDRWGGVGSFLYGTGMSMADFLFTGVISGGAEWVSLGLMGTGAAADSVLEAKSRGLSDDQAFALGTVAGAAEILTEKVSVDRVFGAIRDKNGWVGKNIKEVLLNLAGDTIAEGTEEAVSDVINCVADILAAGEKSEWETAIRTYREQNPGMTESDAFKYAFLDKMKEIGLDFLGGALSGFLMSGGAAGINTGITAAQKNRERSQGIELARQARKEAGTPGDFEFLPDNEGGFTLPTAAETMDTAEDVGEIRTGSEKAFDGTLPTAEESDLERRIDAADTETEKTGLRYGVDQKEIDSAKRLSQATGMKISYFSQDAKNGTMDNGFYNPQTGEIQLNAKSKRKTAVTVAHELTHTFEGTDAYTALQEYAKGDMLRKGKDWASERERIRGLYQRAGIDLPGESAIDAEITAQWMELNFGSERDIAEICRENPSLAKKIRDGLDSVVLKLADLSGTRTLYEAEEIGNVLDAYDRMLQKYEEGIEGSLKTSRDAEADMPTDAGEAQKNFSTESVESETAGEFYDRMRQAYESGEIDAEQWEDAQSIYDEWQSVGSGERTTVADEGPEGRIPAWFREKKETLENAITRKAGERELPQPETGTEANRQTAGDIREEQEVKTVPETMAAKAEREASESRESIVSSAKFKKWFGDSMVTEVDGSPKLMYHGTSNGGFEMFDAWGKSNYGLFGTGSYFTDNPDVAETYTKKGKGKNPQIYPVYLSIQNPIDMDAAADIEAWKAALTLEEESDFGFDLRALDNLKTNEDVYREIEDQVESFDVGKIEGAEIMQSILEGMGYDGITHIGGGRVNADDPRHRVYIAFEGGQVKSAVQNNGDFSPDDWNIHHSVSRVTAGNADEVLAEKENAETYLRLCAEQGRIPKFARFLQDNGDGSWSLKPDGSTDGYWKLLTDYKMYDNNDNGAPQRLVRPDIDMDAAREILEDYKGGANSLPVAQDIVNRFVAEKRGGVQHSVSDENETGPFYELPAKARSNALKIEAQLARRLDSALDLGLAGPNGGMTDALKQFRMEKVRPIVESFLRGEEPETAALWTEYSTDPLQQHAFDAAFEEAVPALERIRGYSERVRQEREASDKRNAELDAQIPTETEDLVKLAESVKQAKRNLSTIRGRLMLTEQDQQTVRNLLSGEMTDAQVQSTSPENADQIIEAANAEREYRSAVAPWARYTQRLASRRRAEADKHLEDAAKWKDKTAGWKYGRETAERNIRDIVPDAATTDALVRDYFRPVHTAEAKSTRFKNDYIRRVQDLKLGMKATGNNTASESYAVQYLGEAEDNIRYLKTIRSPKAVRDGHNLQEWQAEVEAFKADNPDMDWAKVNKGIQEFSTIYGELIGQMNGVLVENGYMPVNVRRGYFPHFNGGEDTIMARFGNLLGMKINTAALPTSINGLTAGFKPGKTWFGHAQERLGFQTTYDAVQGFQNYIGGVADVIHQTDNLRNLRALATQVRYRTSDEQIQNQIDEIMANDTLDEAERQTLVDALKQNGRYQLSNFVAWLDEYTNLLANKKSKFDRGVEDLMGRGFYAGMKNLEGRVAANMISANLGSALTNFIPLNQASAMLGDRNVLRGMYQTVRGYASDDGFRDRSDFLVNRRGTDPLYQKTSQKISEFLSTPMNLIDNFTSESIVRAAYNRYRNQGMDAEEAMTAADEFAAGVMADRSKGAQPVIFGSRNPLLKLFTQFQVEVNNEYSTIFKDIPRDYKDKAVWILLRYFLGAYLFNDLYEKVVGRRAALDPVDLINETVGGLTGYQAPNTVDLVGDLIGGEDIDWGSAEDREDPYVAITDTLSGAAEELPFIGGVAGGGRIPISSALPDKDNMLKALLSTSWSPKKRLFTAGQEIGKSIGTYVIPPFAGGFGKKIADTAVNMARGGRYTVDKDGNDVLQYPYYTDDGAVGTALRSALFGPTATEGGQEWIESGFKSLSAEQTSDYQGLTNYGADQRRAYEVAQMPGSKKADKIAKYRASIDLVDSADDKDSVFEFMADGKDANKFRAAKQCAGLDAETYVGWLEFLPRYDADGNGSMTQAETITAIDDYARKVGLTYPERAALYQLQGTTWKENPYDNEVGAAIKAMLGK